MVLPATYPPPAQWAVGGAAPLPRTVSARSWRRQRATGWGERGAAARGNAAALWGAALLLFRRRCFWRVDTNAECTTCEACVTCCPTHIDIRKGLQLECINCLECVDACTTVMGKLGKPSLVTWSSEYETIDQKGKTKYFRGKVLGYIALLLGLMVILGVMGSEKENMLLNINKEGRLYSTKVMPDGNVRVDNAYVFLLQNTQNEKMDFYFDVIPPKGMEGKITIAKPNKKFSATPGVKKKKVVILRTTEVLADDARNDTVIPIKIRAYAIGHEENIVVHRDAVFIFPKSDVLNKKK